MAIYSMATARETERWAATLQCSSCFVIIDGAGGLSILLCRSLVESCTIQVRFFDGSLLVAYLRFHV